MPIVKVDRKKALADIAGRDWTKSDALTDDDIAAQVAANPDAAPLIDSEDFSKWRNVPARAEIDVSALRRRLGMTQAEFARAYRFTLPALRAIEQGRRHPTGTTAALIELIAADPDYVRRHLARNAKHEKGADIGA
jgi:putative transcriptional regulator